MSAPMSNQGTAHVGTDRERLAGVVQAVGRRPADIERRRWESALVFVVFLVGYSWFGHWLVVDMHVVGFETLDRFNRALMIWHNDPAKLAAVGFDYPPLSILLIAPLTVFSGLASSFWVIPVGSALFASFTMVILNTMMRRAQVQLPLRVGLLASLGLNPLFVLYAAGGAGHVIWLAFVVAALGALFAWYVTGDIRFVMIAGLAYSVAALAGYNSLLWFLVSAIMVGAVLARLGADGTEIEGSTVAFAAPTVYVISLWTAFNLILVFRPFNWITARSDAVDGGGTEDLGVVEILVATGKLVFYGAPIAIVVLPALIFAGLARRNAFALWLGVLLSLAVLSPPVSALLGLTDQPMVMRHALPILLMALVGFLWLARSAGTGSSPVAALGVVALLVSIPWTFGAMEDFQHQNLESEFAAALSTGRSQEGAVARDGAPVGYASEELMANCIDENISTRSSILTDNAQTYAVMLLTGDPDLFFDRVDRSDGPWRDAAQDPAAYVDHMLLSTDAEADLLSQTYPDAADGSSVFLTDVCSTPRYRLVRVPEGFSGAARLEDPEAVDELSTP